MKVTLVFATLLLLACNRSEPGTKAGAAPEAAIATPLAAVAPAPPPPPPAPVTITAAAGQALRVRTASALSTKTAQNGEVFTAVLADPLVVNGVTLAGQGATVTGVVSSSDPGGRVKGVASLAVRLTGLELTNGRTVSLATNSFVKTAPHTKKKDALKVGIGSGIGAAIGAIAGGGKGAAIGAGAGAGAGTGAVLGTRGDPAVIPSESLLTFRLQRPVSMTR